MFKTAAVQVLSLQQILSEMDSALDVEIKTQESGSRSTRHVAVDGHFLEEQEGLYLYQFSLTDPWDVNDDSPTRIQGNNDSPIQAPFSVQTG